MSPLCWPLSRCSCGIGPPAPQEGNCRCWALWAELLSGYLGASCCYTISSRTRRWHRGDCCAAFDFCNFLCFTPHLQWEWTGASGGTSAKQEGASVLILKHAELLHTLLGHTAPPARVVGRELTSVKIFQDLLSVSLLIMGYSRKKMDIIRILTLTLKVDSNFRNILNIS